VQKIINKIDFERERKGAGAKREVKDHFLFLGNPIPQPAPFAKLPPTDRWAALPANSGYQQKLVEDRRGQFVAIAAGYTKEMGEFLSSNSGMASRFNETVTFRDYKADIFYQFQQRINCLLAELVIITLLQCIGFVNEQYSAHSHIHIFFHCQGRLTYISRNQLLSRSRYR